jgi:hypothetical protein
MGVIDMSKEPMKIVLALTVREWKLLGYLVPDYAYTSDKEMAEIELLQKQILDMIKGLD